MHPLHQSDKQDQKGTDMKKYEFTGVTKPYGPTTLHQIRALIDVRPGVKSGDIGGWTEGEHNLIHEGSCWIYPNAMVIKDATICGDAVIKGNATIAGSIIVTDTVTIEGYSFVTGNAILNVDLYIGQT